MKLLEAIEGLDGLDPEATIYVAEPWTPDAMTVVAVEPDDDPLPPEAMARGLCYFLEVSLARQVRDEFLANSPTRAGAEDVCKRVVDYATNDA